MQFPRCQSQAPESGTGILQLRSDLLPTHLGISMPVVDAATAKFYSLQASETALRYESVARPVARFFGAAFALGSRVLDIGADHGYADLVPAMRRVVQAAGRILRTPQDRGWLWLLDDRYRRTEVIELLPSWWQLSGAALASQAQTR